MLFYSSLAIQNNETSFPQFPSIAQQKLSIMALLAPLLRHRLEPIRLGIVISALVPIALADRESGLNISVLSGLSVLVSADKEAFVKRVNPISPYCLTLDFRR